MGESRLDALAKDLANGGISRRTALRRFLGGAAGLAVPSVLIAEPALAKCPNSRKCGSKCCKPGFKCKKGKCKCKSGLKKCGKKCVDVAIDPANCGSCGHVCAAGQTCVAGQCTGGGSTGPVCGNHIREAGEICDGTDFNGATCQSLGFLSGTLACSANCTYDTSGCVAPSCTTAADCPQGPAGDCQKAVCNSGTCGFVADDTDVPADDGNQCTNDICNGGVPAHPPKNAGVSCTQSGGSVCNGAGVCGACVPGSTLTCYTGPAGTAGVGICHAGNKMCQANGTFGPCVGEVTPGMEICGNTVDDDCDGQLDEGCFGICGDGHIGPGEQCDDGNGNSGDGCSSTCLVEAGWTCVGQPSNCSPICGDGLVRGTEVCDGANLNGHTCQTEGFDGGTLACSPGCHSFDTSGCSNCANVGAACQRAESGHCTTSGIIACNNGQAFCDAPPGAPSAQVGQACDDGGVGACRGTGTVVCSADGTNVECDITSPGHAPQAEVCNGIDDDCDGVIDNGFDVGQACTCSPGVNGTKQCSVDGTTTVCVC